MVLGVTKKWSGVLYGVGKEIDRKKKLYRAGVQIFVIVKNFSVPRGACCAFELFIAFLNDSDLEKKKKEREKVLR